MTYYWVFEPTQVALYPLFNSKQPWRTHIFASKDTAVAGAWSWQLIPHVNSMIIFPHLEGENYTGKTSG